jgi:uncharacterized membrane protein
MASASPYRKKLPKEREPLPVPARVAVLVKQVALALALCASTVLLIDYKNAGDPAFCGVASGCFAVRASAYSHLFGVVPLPSVAIPAFGLLLAGSIFATTAQHHRLVAGAAGLGGLVAVALIAIQAFFVGAFCPWCVIVDGSAILAGVAAILLWFWVGDDAGAALKASVQGKAALAWGVLGALAVALPFLWARYPAIPPLPPEIAAQAEPGKLTIVSFTDFECPFCRKLHPTLDAIREKYKDKLHFVRKMKPLVGHPGALPAAKAWTCAPPAQRDAVAVALYEMDPANFKEDKLVALADKMDLGGRDAFGACMRAEATSIQIDADSQLFLDVHGRGLPLTYVGGRVIMGFAPERVASAVEAEVDGPPPALPIAAMFAVLGASAAVALFLSWRQPPPASPAEREPKDAGAAPPSAAA